MSHFPKAIFLISLALLMSACGGGVRGQMADQGEFVAYAQAFELAAMENGRYLGGQTFTIPIQYGETLETEYAVCKFSVIGEPRILVNEKIWKRISDTTRDMVMFHELGHCVLGREHRTGTVSMHSDTTILASVMNPTLVYPKAFETERGYYMRELFTTSH